jgi:hypothetical protein
MDVLCHIQIVPLFLIYSLPFADLVPHFISNQKWILKNSDLLELEIS